MKGVYSILFDRIVRGHYPPGSRLREEAIAEEFGVSRTPVREALGQLSQDLLVDLIPRKGARTRAFTIDDLDEAYEIRRVLELLAVERGIGSMKLADLTDIRRRIEATGAERDAQAHARLDSDFHALIAASAPGLRLRNQLDALYRIMHAFRELVFEHPDVRVAARMEHIAIVDALISRDLERARTLLAEHTSRSRTRLIDAVANAPTRK